MDLTTVYFYELHYLLLNIPRGNKRLRYFHHLQCDRFVQFFLVKHGINKNKKLHLINLYSLKKSSTN